jgi:Rrf2 family transcriptional regulator, nitric oxide-sensitive transcriptional repressor
MLNKTTVTAIRALQHIAGNATNQPVPPRQIAAAIGESPSYLAKIARDLAKAGIVRSENGAKGGIHLTRKPDSITLQEIVEACEGVIVGRFCPSEVRGGICSFHEAALELHGAMVSVLKRWTLADLMVCPFVERISEIPCVMSGSRGRKQGQQADL